MSMTLKLHSNILTVYLVGMYIYGVIMFDFSWLVCIVVNIHIVPFIIIFQLCDDVVCCLVLVG